VHNSVAGRLVVCNSVVHNSVVGNSVVHHLVVGNRVVGNSVVHNPVVPSGHRVCSVTMETESHGDFFLTMALKIHMDFLEKEINWLKKRTKKPLTLSDKEPFCPRREARP
jgi:hypothetical protein